jgi:hypothetical protein
MTRPGIQPRARASRNSKRRRRNRASFNVAAGSDLSTRLCVTGWNHNHLPRSSPATAVLSSVTSTRTSHIVSRKDDRTWSSWFTKRSWSRRTLGSIPRNAHGAGDEGHAQIGLVVSTLGDQTPFSVRQVTRSLQTDPSRIRAARRSASPRSSRGESESARRRRAFAWKTLGLSAPEQPDQVGSVEPVRVRATRPRAGLIHPLGRRQVLPALDFFGPLATYGLRTVELRHADLDAQGVPVLSRLRVPGTVILYEQRPSPWTIGGRLSEESLRRLRDAGAIVNARPSATIIDWPEETLAQFMLFEGLMHEVGHHLIQHHTGKRTARVMRTADHERAAERFAAACRAAWAARLDPS